MHDIPIDKNDGKERKKKRFNHLHHRFIISHESIWKLISLCICLLGCHSLMPMASFYFITNKNCFFFSHIFGIFVNIFFLLPTCFSVGKSYNISIHMIIMLHYITLLPLHQFSKIKLGCHLQIFCV